MSLENLLAIRRLIKLDATPDNIRKLLTAAERNLADAKVTNISVENRFDAAYKAIMQCAMAALWAAGYRTSTSEPGHHQTAIQVLPLTLSVAADTVIVLDALRKQRNLSDYSGDSISDATLRECLVQAENLLRLAKQKLLMGE
ncbi:MAG: hypothetical protein ROW52_12095 [Anaerolineaceae bacterium]